MNEPLSYIGVIVLVSFVVSGFILNKKLFWGSLFGILPAIYMIYMAAQDTGQIINEIPIGIIIITFYTICGFFVYAKTKKS